MHGAAGGGKGKLRPRRSSDHEPNREKHRGGAEAEARLARYLSGTDHEAVKGLIASFGLQASGKEKPFVTRSRKGLMATTLTGSAASLRQQIEHVLKLTKLDGMMLIFPDYIEDVRFFGEQVLPHLHAGAREAA